MASDKLIKHRFRIEGHTDAAGNEKYNKMLSDKRAVSVKNYLASVYGIDTRRLEDIGMGETSLMDKVNPLSGLNRRVQIVNLGN